MRLCRGDLKIHGEIIQFTIYICILEVVKECVYIAGEEESEGKQ